MCARIARVGGEAGLTRGIDLRDVETLAQAGAELGASSAAVEALDHELECFARSQLALRPDDGGRGGQHGVRCVAGFAAGLRCRQVGPPYRLM
jgi:hypothetical protein